MISFKYVLSNIFQFSVQTLKLWPQCKSFSLHTNNKIIRWVQIKECNKIVENFNLKFQHIDVLSAEESIPVSVMTMHTPAIHNTCQYMMTSHMEVLSLQDVLTSSGVDF